MTSNEIRKMDTSAIEAKVTELKEQLFNLKYQAATGNLENTAEIGKVRKTIARMKTIINERAE